MTTAGEAASLFGASDPAHDPFAVPLSPDANSSGLHNAGDLFPDQHSSVAAGDLFSANDASFLGTEVAVSDHGAYTSSGYDGQYTGHNPQPPQGSHYYQQNYAPNYDQHDAWGVYASQPQQINETYGNPTHAIPSFGQDGETSYRPTSYASYDARNASQQHTFDPYAPPATSLHASQPSVLSHDPYKPPSGSFPQQTAVATHSEYNHTRPSHFNPATVSRFSADVPPPLPSASAYRPKMSNAYDPPLPPPKQPKRAPNRQPQAAPLSHSPFYGGDNEPVLSPPPRGQSANRQVSAQVPPPQGHLNQYAPPQFAAYHAGTTEHDRSHPVLPTPPIPLRAPDAYRPGSEPVNTYISQSSSNGYFANGDLDLRNFSAPHQQPNDQQEIHGGTTRTVSGPHYGQNVRNNQHSQTYPEDAARVYERVPTPLGFGEGETSEFTSSAPFNLSTSPALSSSQPLLRQHSPTRAKSPGSSSIKSAGSSSASRRSLDQPNKKYSGYSQQSPYEHQALPNRQASTSPSAIRRTTSPTTFTSVGPLTGRDGAPADAYTSLGDFSSSLYTRDRSMSASSSFSSASAPPRDPYAPSAHSRQQSTDSHKIPPVTYLPLSDVAYSVSPAMTITHDRSVGQTLPVVSRAPPAPYAPSPSLLGSNDPLGRTSARVPVVSFGFGGKLVTCFHGASALHTGFDVALSSRQSTDIQVRVLHQVIPESALDASPTSYPGPLFSDPGTPTTSLVRTGAASQAKSKKARVVKFLEERAEEITRGLGYIHPGSLEGKRTEAKHKLLLLLKVLVENDGKLSGSTQIDNAVRQVLAPEITKQDPLTEGINQTSLLTGALPAIPSAAHSSTGSSQRGVPLSTQTLRASHLDKLSKLLIRGERRSAFQYAADEKLWAHAMVIASSIDKDAFREVVKEFVHSELASHRDSSSPPHVQEPLRVAYSLFAGQGAASVHELAPQRSLIENVANSAPPATSATPSFPHFAQLTPPLAIPADVLSKWPETAAMIISNPMTPEASSALTALGDQLSANNWAEAAHVCYLLSLQTSSLGGLGAPAIRVVLFGGANPAACPIFWKDPDPIIFSEIVEFALSLVAPAKGQESFTGLPHLQAYRLLRAASLAEVGHVQTAHRYCDAISNSLGRSSPYINSTLVSELKSLTERLVAAPQIDKSGSWIGSKMARPSFDKFGNWLEGQFSSFIAGEGEAGVTESSREQTHQGSGPFQHYSEISSATTSAIPTPQRSMTDLTEIANVRTPPYRSESAMALRPPPPTSHVPANRASSVMGFTRRKASPVPRVSSAGPSYADTSIQPVARNYSQLPDTGSKIPENTGRPPQSASRAPLDPTLVGPQVTSWWGVDSTDSGAPTPTASSFLRPDGARLDSAGEFMSIMDHELSATPTPSIAPSGTRTPDANDEFDEEDLGLGNSSHRPKQPGREQEDPTEPGESSSAEVKSSVSASEPEKPTKQNPTWGGWVRGFWKPSGDKPKPVEVNLGEETSFYYDKELKRWVNKAGAAPEKAAKPTAPPPRAQTASPGITAARLPYGPPVARTPPMRPATTSIDLTDSPPKQLPPRVRSNLVPPDAATSAPGSPSSTTSHLSMDGPPGLDGPPPPGARARTQAKRNVRNRYVDVFQQGGQ